MTTKATTLDQVCSVAKNVAETARSAIDCVKEKVVNAANACKSWFTAAKKKVKAHLKSWKQKVKDWLDRRPAWLRISECCLYGGLLGPPSPMMVAIFVVQFMLLILPCFLLLPAPSMALISVVQFLIPILSFILRDLINSSVSVCF
ncbi:hypothetical protein Dimus_023598 [Dionaea muscipula]